MIALVCIAAGAARAQLEVELLANDAVRMTVSRLGESISRGHPDAPVKISARLEKSAAYRGEGLTMLIAPDRAFSAKTIEEAGEKAVPAGWVAVRGVVPMVQGKRVPVDRLATAEVDGKELVILFLAVRKEGENRILEVYSEGATPLRRVTLARKDKAGGVPHPLQARFANLDREAEEVDWILVLDGGYEATLRLATTH
jgi:hypothetical protein